MCDAACTALQPDRPRSEINWSPRNSGIRTLAVSSCTRESRVAVCLIPGIEVVFERDAERALTGFQIFFRKPPNTGYKVARFRQVNMDNPCAHHDALEFPDGQIVLLTHLRTGQRVTVLQLPNQLKAGDLARSRTSAEALVQKETSQRPLDSRAIRLK